MVELVESEFYHIHSLNDKSNFPNKHSGKWINGNVLSFGDLNVAEMNLLHDRVFNPHFSIDWEKNHIKELTKNRITAGTLEAQKNIETDYFHKGFLFKYFQLTREIVLENVRQLLFPEKPSRLNGIWLTNKDNLETWLRLIPENEISQKIFLVRFTGKMHKADARWITNKTLSFESYYKNAVGYWTGLPQSKRGKPDEEYIGNGIIEIIKEVKY